MPSILDQLAHALGRRDEVPNIELAALIHKQKDLKSIKVLVELLSDKNSANATCEGVWQLKQLN